jgi:energy-coupling factor transporter ATP-binding protein EcfA2
MSIWKTYPETYRNHEVQNILSAVESGECVSMVGLSGAGKSNLSGFLYHRCQDYFNFKLIDCNRLSAPTIDGLLSLIGRQLGWVDNSEDILSQLEKAIETELHKSPAGLCLLLDSFDPFNIPTNDNLATARILRALRDRFKYELTYVITTRRPLFETTELAELFFGKTLWLGPLSLTDARWSAEQFFSRKNIPVEDTDLEKLLQLTGNYPAFLRAACEAFADGAGTELAALKSHPAAKRRVTEFLNDGPDEEMLQLSGLENIPLLEQKSELPWKRAQLTAKENALLTYFLEHPHQICAKDAIIRNVWPEDRVYENGLRDDTLAQLIRRLRRKIETDPSQPQFLETIPGRGYRFNL